MGTQREFLEGNDHFIVIPGEGNRYTVELVGSSSGGAASKKKMKKGNDSLESLEEQATQEAMKQLQKPNNGGKVWIPNWNVRFKDSLGSLREFLEGSDRFIVHEGEGSKFTVELMDEL